MRIGVILASHGEFARAALGAVEMIAGKQGDVVALGLTAEKSLETFEAAKPTRRSTPSATWSSPCATSTAAHRST